MDSSFRIYRLRLDAQHVIFPGRAVPSDDFFLAADYQWLGTLISKFRAKVTPELDGTELAGVVEEKLWNIQLTCGSRRDERFLFLEATGRMALEANETFIT